MEIAIQSYNAKYNSVAFTAPGHAKVIQLKNRSTVPAAIAKATALQVMSSCSAAQIHEQLLVELMPDIQKKLASGKNPPRVLAYLTTPVLLTKREISDPNTWQNKIETSQAVRKHYNGLTPKTKSKTASFDGETRKTQALLMEELKKAQADIGQLEAQNTELQDDNTELREKNALLLQQKEEQLMQLQLARAFVNTPQKQRYGEAAADRLLEELEAEQKGTGPRRSLRTPSEARAANLNAEAMWGEHQLRQLGKHHVRELLISAKGNKGGVLQLIDYISDRHEVRQLRGEEIRSAVETVRSIRSCVEVLRTQCQTFEAQDILHKILVACSTSEISDRAQCLALTGSENRAFRTKIARAGKAREEFDAAASGTSCSDCMCGWRQQQREQRKDAIAGTWIFEYVWHSDEFTRRVPGARGTKRKWVSYLKYDVHDRRVQDRCTKDIFDESLHDEIVQQWLSQYPDAAKNYTCKGLEANRCWCVGDPADARCVCEECYQEEYHYLHMYNAERRKWQHPEGVDVDRSRFTSSSSLQHFHESIFQCGRIEYPALQGEELWPKECAYGECENRCVDKWAAAMRHCKIENSSTDMMEWLKYADVTNVATGRTQKEPIQKRGTRRVFVKEFVAHTKGYLAHRWEHKYKEAVNKVKKEKLKGQTNIMSVWTDFPTATSHDHQGAITCNQPHTTSYPVFYVYYPQGDEEIELEIWILFNPGGEQNAKVHHAGLDLLIRYYQGEKIENDGQEYKRATPLLSKDGKARVWVDHDGCGGQYFGRTNYYRVTQIPRRLHVLVTDVTAVRAKFKGPWDGTGGACEGILRRAEREKPPRRLATTVEYMRECRRVFKSGEEKKRRKAKSVYCLLLEPEYVKKFELCGDPEGVDGSRAHHVMYAGWMADGKAGFRVRDCGCTPCCEGRYGECEMKELSMSRDKRFTADDASGWSLKAMMLKQEAGIAINKRKRVMDSDEGWKVMEGKLAAALKPGMIVAVYSGSEAGSSGIPYWLGRVKEAKEGGAAFKVKKGFTACGTTFNKNQRALDIINFEWKGVDTQGRQKHQRTDEVQTVRPTSLLPVMITAADTSTNMLYLFESMHQKIMEAADSVAPEAPSKKKRKKKKNDGSKKKGEQPTKKKSKGAKGGKNNGKKPKQKQKKRQKK